MFSKLEKKVSVFFHLETVHLISIYNNSFHNTHLYFKRLLSFQEYLSFCSWIGKASTPASNRGLLPQHYNHRLGKFFHWEFRLRWAGGTLGVLKAHEQWELSGEKEVYHYWQPNTGSQRSVPMMQHNTIFTVVPPWLANLSRLSLALSVHQLDPLAWPAHSLNPGLLRGCRRAGFGLIPQARPRESHLCMNLCAGPLVCI